MVEEQLRQLGRDGRVHQGPVLVEVERLELSGQLLYRGVGHPHEVAFPALAELEVELTDVRLVHETREKAYVDVDGLPTDCPSGKGRVLNDSYT